MPSIAAKISPADSALSADSMAAMPKYEPKYIEAFPDSSGNALSITRPDELAVITVPDAVAAPEPRIKSPLYDNGTMLLVLAVIFVITVSYSKGYKYVADFFHNISSVRARQNLFEDHTVKETQIMTALTANTCIFESILLFEAFLMLHPEAAVPGRHIFKYVATLAVAAALFHLAQLALYHLLGFIFSDNASTKLWLDAFKAVRSMLGVVLAPVAFAMMICPSFTKMALIISILLYFAAQLIIICKAFRIFFNNLQSSLYFILYLCSVEIVPVILSFAGAMNLCIILQMNL